LTTIQGAASLLQRDAAALDHETQQEFLADIASESRRLGSLIENMVQLANVRAGRMPMETEPVLIQRMLDGAVAAIHQFAPEREVTVSVEPMLLAEADPDRIDQVVRNLLHNAIKYAPADRPIEVTAERSGAMVRVGVRDYGPGIDAADLPRLFDRFSRTSGAISSGAPGMGLGLYLSRHVIEAHGGEISIEQPDGGGTCVWFTIPAVEEA
jgi:signal transduction histidine kinase